MKLSVIPNDFNAYFELHGSGLVPPLLVSSIKGLFLLTDFWVFACASIKHIRLYLSRLEVVKYSSNAKPCNLEHIIVLYHGPLSGKWGNSSMWRTFYKV